MQKNKGIILIVILLGLVIIAGLILLGYGILQKSKDRDFKLFNISSKSQARSVLTSEPNIIIKKPSEKQITIPLDKNESVEQVMLSKNNIIVKISDGSKNMRIMILDSGSGTVLKQIVFR